MRRKQATRLSGQGSETMNVVEKEHDSGCNSNNNSPHTFLEVTRLWEKASSLMTGENAEEEAHRGLSYAANHLHHGLCHHRATPATNHCFFGTHPLVFVRVLVLTRSIKNDDMLKQ